MRILVYPHDLNIGGSQINAIDLAAGVAGKGHHVVVYGIPGPLVDYVSSRGLRFVEARQLRYRPAPSRIAQLATLALRERLDLIHTYEWPPCLDAYYGAALLCGVPVLCTVLGMTVMPLVPRSVPLIMGTAQLGEDARRRQRGPVWVLEPPIDTVNDHPEIDGRAFRRVHAVGEADLLIVTVSRLAVDLKLDALVRAIDATELLASRFPVRLVVIGDGAARSALLERANRINAKWGRQLVSLPGADLDPRPAYAAADVVVGMGSSALRALAIGRPVIVQGEQGFSEIFEPETLDLFLHQGFYGLSTNESGATRLAGQLAQLLDDPSRRSFLGTFGRATVTERFSLARAVDYQLEIYDQVRARGAARRLGDAVQSASLALSREIANHDPRRKRGSGERVSVLLNAARSGEWPPRT